MTTQLTVTCIRKGSFEYTDLVSIAYEKAYEKSIEMSDMAITLTDHRPTWFDIPASNPEDYLYFIIETEEDDDG